MKFLNRNQYAIWYSDRCNYKCSYCCNNASPTAPKSATESNPAALIDLLRRVDPGMVMISGGEPGLWKEFPVLLENLPQHYWVILTNLSFIPGWMSHPNIKLVIPAFHEEFATPDRFTGHLAELRTMGKRHHVKIIVKPGREYEQIRLWEKWNSPTSPASLTPLEYNYYFDRRFLKDVIGRLRTSCLYNARFFRQDSPQNVYCKAGTKEAFQVNSDGSLVRCSTIFEQLGHYKTGSIFTPDWNLEAKLCESPSCYCEWHHWGEMALANDNQTWTKYVETGEWSIPTETELHEFIIKMRWNPSGRNTKKSTTSLFSGPETAKAAIVAPAPVTLADRCRKIEKALPLTNEQLFTPFRLLEGHPWSPTARDNRTSYYPALFGIAQEEKPRKILEIGSAFGLSCATLLTASPGVELFVSIDLGIYGSLYPEKLDNIPFARERVHSWCRAHGIDTSRVRFYQANSQPRGKGDNTNFGADVPQWSLIPEVVQLLREHEFDIVFVDGKHTEDGLLNDMRTFWQFLKPGGLLICDDIHEPVEYAGTFDWVGDTWRSYHSFLYSLRREIAEAVLWNFPEVPPFGKLGKRPFGLIRKSPARFPAARRPEFSMSKLALPGLSEALIASQPPLAQVPQEVPASDCVENCFIEAALMRLGIFDPSTSRIRLPSNVKRVWLDVGAHQCETTLSELECREDIAVIAFEPLEELCENLLGRSPRLFPLPFAVSAQNGQAPLFATEFTACSSLHPFNPKGLDEWKVKTGLRVKEQRKVKTIRLDEILKRLPLPEVEFLKIDAQGHDLEVVRSAGVHLNRIRRLQVEVAVTKSQLYAGAATKMEVVAFLTQKGFRLTSASPQTNGQEENLSFENQALTAVQAFPPSSRPCESNARGNADQAVAHARLGRMLNRSGSISEEEFKTATETLARVLASNNPAEFIARTRDQFPAAVMPLLILYIVDAIKFGNEKLAELLESVFGLLTKGRGYSSSLAGPEGSPSATEVDANLGTKNGLVSRICGSR